MMFGMYADIDISSCIYLACVHIDCSSKVRWLVSSCGMSSYITTNIQLLLINIQLG